MAKIVMLTVYFIQKFRKHTVLKTFFFFQYTFWFGAWNLRQNERTKFWSKYSQMTTDWATLRFYVGCMWAVGRLSRST